MLFLNKVFKKVSERTYYLILQHPPVKLLWLELLVMLPCLDDWADSKYISLSANVAFSEQDTPSNVKFDIVLKTELVCNSVESQVLCHVTQLKVFSIVLESPDQWLIVDQRLHSLYLASLVSTYIFTQYNRSTVW